MALLELDSKLLRDERFDALGALAGTGKHDVRSRVLGLWYECLVAMADTKTADDIDILTGWIHSARGRFADLMVQSLLAEQTADGYRIKGVRERLVPILAWSQRKHDAQVAGGKARVKKAERGADGKFAPKTSQLGPATHQLPTSYNQLQPGSPVPCSLSPEEEGNTTTGTATEDRKGTKRQISDAYQTWTDTLASFDVPALPIGTHEESTLQRAIRYSGFTRVSLALEGARYEVGSKDYDPRQHLSLDRVLHRINGKSNLDRFANLALERRNKSASKKVYDPVTKSYVEDRGSA